MPETNLQVLLASRPQGWPSESNFKLVETPVPNPENGQALIKNLFLSLDPYMRGRMNDVRSYAPKVELGEVIGFAERDLLSAVMQTLRDDPRFACEQAMDICGVDWPERAERFDVVYNLLSVSLNQRLRVIVTTDAEPPVASVHEIWPAATWWEREAWDLYGIIFSGQPDLRRILTDVMAVLSGGQGNRVLQLRTPFGGGKTHTLLALYHLARSRHLLSDMPDLESLPDPGEVRTAVISGIETGAADTQTLHRRTIWGELAWQLGREEGYALVAEQDRLGIAPGAEVISRLIGTKPALILLDEAHCAQPFAATADAVRAALQTPSRILYAETISNPLLRVADVQALAALAHERDCLLVVDNTFATPVLSRPLEHGADLVMDCVGGKAGVRSFAQAQDAAQTDPRLFAPTGYRIDKDSFWDYFAHRGGISTFGYPVSRDFQFLGCTSQFFQRVVLQQCANQGVKRLD